MVPGVVHTPPLASKMQVSGQTQPSCPPRKKTQFHVPSASTVSPLSKPPTHAPSHSQILIWTLESIPFTPPHIANPIHPFTSRKASRIVPLLKLSREGLKRRQQKVMVGKWGLCSPTWRRSGCGEVWLRAFQHQSVLDQRWFFLVGNEGTHMLCLLLGPIPTTKCPSHWK